jgi:hypothetical protein
MCRTSMSDGGAALAAAWCIDTSASDAPLGRGRAPGSIELLGGLRRSRFCGALCRVFVVRASGRRKVSQSSVKTFVSISRVKKLRENVKNARVRKNRPSRRKTPRRDPVERALNPDAVLSSR